MAELGARKEEVRHLSSEKERLTSELSNVKETAARKLDTEAHKARTKEQHYQKSLADVEDLKKKLESQLDMCRNKNLKMTEDQQAHTKVNTELELRGR